MTNKEDINLLDRINSPSDLKNLSLGELYLCANEIRELIIKTVSRTGGHLSSNLGAVELTLALHRVFDSPNDLFIWDVGHQCYTHKIVTGRKNRFHTLRQLNGISGFPNPAESEHDHFISGHGSTAISQALGCAAALELKDKKNKVIAIVGDGSLVGGMAFEALNYLGHVQKDILIVLNDNEWAISKTVGAISRYLTKIITDPIYNKVSQEFEKLLLKFPRGDFALKTIKKFEESIKNLLVPGIIFEEMGIKYVGPVQGHNLEELIQTLKNIKEYTKPVIIHVLTKKGKGYRKSEENPDLYHSTSPFDYASGAFIKTDKKTYTDVFSETIVDLAMTDSKIVTVTAAMPHGTGLMDFKGRFQNRFFDVGMAEQNAVTFSSALAKSGLKPYVAIYSTFIQRAYDQIMHDVCLQNLPVKFCLDRAGLVGEDGPTHHGIFDIAFLKHLPNITLLAPRDAWEFRLMLQWMKDFNSPVAIRYPKKFVPQRETSGYKDIALGKAEMLTSGEDFAIFAYGEMVEIGYKVLQILSEDKIYPYLVNLRFAKPLDEEMIISLARKVSTVFVLEEASLLGGIGESIAAIISKNDIQCRVLPYGISDSFVPHGSREALFKLLKIDEATIAERIKNIQAEKIWQR